jgi:hypothetical protein
MIVTILTGNRLDLLQRTVRSVDSMLRLPGVTITALVHSGDEQSVQWLCSELEGLDCTVMAHSGSVSNGAATSELAEAAATSGHDYWMHLEDDWECMYPSTLRAAAAAAPGLISGYGLGQLRLRLASDPVKPYNMVSGEDVEWTSNSEWLRIGRTHYTFNPGIMPVSVARSVFPAVDEPDAMLRYHATGLLTGQLTPGLFRHIGDGRSLEGH